MPGYLVCSVKRVSTNQLQWKADEELGKKWAEAVEKLAQERNVKCPKRIGYDGCYGSWISMNYTSNAMQDLVREAAKSLGLTVLRQRHNGKPIGY